MDTSRRSYSLVARLRLMLWAMLLLPILAGVIFFLMYSSRALQDSAVRDLSAELSLERQYIEYWVEDRANDINFLAGDPRVQNLGPEALRGMLQAQLKGAPDFDDLVYVDKTGHTRADANYSPDLDVSDREYFQAGREGRSFISDVLISRSTGRHIFIVSSPVRDAHGRFLGLVFGAVPLDALSTLLRTLRTESASQTFLASGNGTLIAPSELDAGLKPGDAILDRARAHVASRGIYRNTSGQRVVGTYQWILDGRWLLVAERSEVEIMALHAGILGVPLAGAALVFLVFGPVALRLARSLRAPMLRLEEHARQVEAGNFDMECDPAPDAHAPEEILRLNKAYCVMVDQVRRALSDLRQASFTDHLTGAANRKLLFHEGPRLVEAARRAGQPVSVFMLDLDRFKAVNDTYGHAAGDAVLAAFSSLLRQKLRQSDMFARYGGEEFVILAPNAGGAAARELAERIRAAVQALVVDVDGVGLRFTVSVGTSTLEPGRSAPVVAGGSGPLEALLARADEALYVAKAAGRNRVEVLPLGLVPARS